MAFTPKDWQNVPSTATPLDAAALVDLETRVSAYTDVETERAEVAEGVLGADITAETNRAEGVEATKAPLANPTFTGTPVAPTASPLTDDTQIATTAYADSAVTVEKTRALAVEAIKAPLASPALTGTPTAPTASALTDSTQVATTAYADSAVAVETTRAETAEATKAPLASPAFTGTPTAPTRTPLDDSTKIATTAYTDTAVGVETTRAETAEAALLPKSGSFTNGHLVSANSSGQAVDSGLMTSLVGKATSTTGVDSLPAPTGVGLEFVVIGTTAVPVLQSINLNGVAL